MKAKLALLVAVVLGVIAAMGVRNYLREQEDRVQRQTRPTTVVAYDQRLETGTVILPHMLREREVFRDAVTVSTVDARNRNRILGQRLVRDVERHQIAQWDDFEEMRTGVGEGETGLLPGERAITLGVDNVTGVAGNIRPGSRVDVFGTFQVPADGARPGERAMTTQTALLLSDVAVLATDDRTTLTQYALATRRQGGGYSTVTVATRPAEAQMLIYAQQYGRVTLALRSDGDVLPTDDLPPISERDLLSLAERLERERRARLTQGEAGP